MNTIRLVRPEELDTVWALVRRTVAEMISWGSDQWGDDYPYPEAYAEDIARNELWCVVNEEDTILGVAALVCRHEPDYEPLPFRRSEPAVSMHRVAVDPCAMGQGVAAMLFEQFEKEGLRRGVESLRIDTYCMNDRMQHLITKHGFTKLAEFYFPNRTKPFYCYDKLLKEDNV